MAGKAYQKVGLNYGDFFKVRTMHRTFTAISSTDYKKMRPKAVVDEDKFVYAVDNYSLVYELDPSIITHTSGTTKNPTKQVSEAVSKNTSEYIGKCCLCGKVAIPLFSGCICSDSKCKNYRK